MQKQKNSWFVGFQVLCAMCIDKYVQKHILAASLMVSFSARAFKTISWETKTLMIKFKSPQTGYPRSRKVPTIVRPTATLPYQATIYVGGGINLRRRNIGIYIKEKYSKFSV